MAMLTNADKPQPTEYVQIKRVDIRAGKQYLIKIFMTKTQICDIQYYRTGSLGDNSSQETGRRSRVKPLTKVVGADRNSFSNLRLSNETLLCNRFKSASYKQIPRKTLKPIGHVKM